MFKINRQNRERIIVAGPCIVEVRHVGPNRIEVAVDAADDVRIAKAEELSAKLGRRATLADIHRLPPRSEPE